jgi:hypothetical protein
MRKGSAHGGSLTPRLRATREQEAQRQAEGISPPMIAAASGSVCHPIPTSGSGGFGVAPCLGSLELLDCQLQLQLGSFDVTARFPGTRPSRARQVNDAIQTALCVAKRLDRAKDASGHGRSIHEALPRGSSEQTTRAGREPRGGRSGPGRGSSVPRAVGPQLRGSLGAGGERGEREAFQEGRDAQAQGLVDASIMPGTPWLGTFLEWPDVPGLSRR